MPTAAPTFSDSFVQLEGAGGIEVHLLPTTKYRSVLLEWVGEAPMEGETAARALLPELLTRGTSRWPELSDMAAHCEELFAAELYGSTSALAGRQLLRLGAVTIADRHARGLNLLDQVAELLGEVIHHPPQEDGGFRADHFGQERANLVRAIEGLADDKGHHAQRRLIEVMHAGTPFALHPWGKVEDARALTEAGVRTAWQHMSRAAPARLFLVGDISPERALRLAQVLAAGHSRAAPARPRRPPGRPARAPQRVVEPEVLAQSKLAMGFRIDPNLATSAAARLMGIAFGGGSHSRLFKRVREAEGLAYDCSAAVAQDSASLLVGAGIDAGKAARVEELVVEELAALSRGVLTEDELELSRKAQIRRLQNLVDSPQELCMFRLSALMTGRSHRVEAAIEEALAVRVADVAQVAASASLDTVFLLEGRPA